MPPPLTPEQQRLKDEEERYDDLFSTLAFYERNAKTEDAAGHAEMAAGWRGYFAKRSGLTAEEAVAVEKIAQDYLGEKEATQKNYMGALASARNLRHAANSSPAAIAEARDAVARARDAIESVYPTAKAKLVSALGSRSYSRLDSYTIHMHDNARKFPSQQAAQTNPGVER